MAGSEGNKNWEKIIIVLLTSRTIAEAARQADLSERTIFRLLQDPDFQAEYRRFRQQAVTQTVARLQQMSSEAAEALRQIFRDDNNPASSRTSAARAVLALSIKAFEIEELETRITSIESRLEELSRYGGLEKWPT